jgi:broad specificity phosphatase PhoE
VRTRARARLVCVRHGETSWNTEGRWQGQSGAGLNARGRAQARATASYLATRFGDAALIARSDSQRVAETAEPLVRLLPAPVLVDVRLREVDVGSWSGLRRHEVEQVDPVGWAAYRRDAAHRVGGGETIEAVRARALAVVHEVVDRVDGGTAIVLSHGWTLRILAAALLGDEPDRLPRIPNCSVTVLDVSPGRVERVGYGVCGHLEAGALMSQHGSVAGR